MWQVCVLGCGAAAGGGGLCLHFNTTFEIVSFFEYTQCSSEELLSTVVSGRCQNQLILTACCVRYRIALWANRGLGQL